MVFLGLLTGAIAKYKGSSFAIWFLVGAVLPFIGLVAAILYRFESDEPVRLCSGCGRRLKLSVQVCTSCGTDLFFPGDEEPVGLPAGAGRGTWHTVTGAALRAPAARRNGA